ncbi:MAG: hypothetical protein JNN28_04115 [Saprospiraceae bacterium]|nr:hypothetical protein [Saprospiraceae bacterium]
MHSQIRISLFSGLLMLIFSTFDMSAQTRPEPLPPLDSVSFQDMQSHFGTLFTTATTLKQLLQEKEGAADSLQGTAMQLWSLAKKDSTLAKTTLDSLNKEAKMAKDRFKKINGHHIRAIKLSQWLESIPVEDSVSIRKNLPKAWKQTRQLFDDVYPPAPAPVVEQPATAQDSSALITPVEPSKPIVSQTSVLVKQTVKYNPANDVMLRPSTPPCAIAATSRDEFSGEISKEMTRSEWFRYTNPALKNYLQGKTHVICEAALATTGPNTALLLTFTIQDANARKAFGRLEQNSIAVIKFLDGSSFTLQNAVPDEGIYNPETEIMTYRARYTLNAEVVKRLRRNEVDKVRIAWSKGYEDYEVQQVDLLIRQAACLFGK